MKNNLRVVVYSMAILVFVGFSGGCKKAEEAVKEKATNAAQQVTPVPTAQAGGAAVTEFTYEDGVQKWTARKTTKIGKSGEKMQGGTSGLKITGSSAVGLWDFAASPKFNLEPAKHYSVSGWMLVESVKTPIQKPILQFKVGIYKDGKWMKNARSQAYDMKKMGEWQKLTIEFDAPSESGVMADITIDKMTKDNEMTATIYVDDVVVK